MWCIPNQCKIWTSTQTTHAKKTVIFLNLQYETRSTNYHHSQVTLGMLLNQNRESYGVREPNIEPCETPYLIILKVELWPFTLQHCTLLLRKGQKILTPNLLLCSDSWLSFWSRMLWPIILNAFLISSNTVIDICVVFIYFPITCTFNRCTRCGMRWSQLPLIVIQNFVIY